MNNTISYIIKDLENLESLIKSEAIDGKVEVGSAQEYIRILSEVQEKLSDIKS